MNDDPPARKAARAVAYTTSDVLSPLGPSTGVPVAQYQAPPAPVMCPFLSNRRRQLSLPLPLFANPDTAQDNVQSLPSSFHRFPKNRSSTPCVDLAEFDSDCSWGALSSSPVLRRCYCWTRCRYRWCLRKWLTRVQGVIGAGCRDVDNYESDLAAARSGVSRHSPYFLSVQLSPNQVIRTLTMIRVTFFRCPRCPRIMTFMSPVCQYRIRRLHLLWVPMQLDEATRSYGSIIGSPVTSFI